MSGTMRVAIVGAGIAGLTLAATLERSGVRCRVFEQAPELGEIGAGIQLAPNAMRLLRRLGLAEHLATVCVRPLAIESRRWDDGRLLARTPLGEECEERFGAPYYVVHRADLHRRLAGLVRAGTVRLGATCTRVVDGPDGAALHFADGSVETADLVVGADGIRSTIRRAMYTDAPRFSGHTIYRGLVPAERVSFLFDEPKVMLWLGPGQHCVCYPISAGDLVNIVATTPEGLAETGSWSVPARVEDLVNAYAGWNADVVKLLESADSVTQWALYDRDPVPRWSGRRVTLIGDAAHPMFPFGAQGANQAIEDAIVLAVCLRSRPGDVSTALRRYEAVRVPRATMIHENSRDNAIAFHLPDGDLQRRRDATMKNAHVWRNREWLFGYDAEQVAATADEGSGRDDG